MTLNHNTMNPITEDDIANYLANTPDFFFRHAELLASVQLTSPHGNRAVSLQEGVGVFYDPALDRRSGWTSPASGIWASASAPRRLRIQRLELRTKATSGLQLIKIESNASHAAPVSVDEV